jgi:hypothetical protein
MLLHKMQQHKFNRMLGVSGAQSALDVALVAEKLILMRFVGSHHSNTM